MTDDGDLAHRMLSPSHHVMKVYVVKLAKPYQIKYVDLFKKGIDAGGGDTFLPALVRGAEYAEKLAFVGINEGKFHQVRRMMECVDNHVEKLMRISYGNLVIPEKLGFGDTMELLHKDVEKIFEAPDFDRICHDFSPFFSAFLINN